MIAKLRQEVRQLQELVKKLKPASGPGMLTSQTTRGVTRKPTAGPTSAGSNSSTTQVPRWG